MPATIDLTALERQAAAFGVRAKTASQLPDRLATFLSRRLPPEAKRDIGKQYNLRPSRIAQGLRTLARSGAVELTASGSGINLIEFGARQTPTGVTATVENGKAPRQIPHGFIATAPNGKRLAFIRDLVGGRRTGRLPMRGLFGAYIAEMLRNGDREKRLSDFAQEGCANEAARLLDMEIK
jgi:hypothetical protein